MTQLDTAECSLVQIPASQKQQGISLVLSATWPFRLFAWHIWLGLKMIPQHRVSSPSLSHTVTCLHHVCSFAHLDACPLQFEGCTRANIRYAPPELRICAALLWWLGQSRALDDISRLFWPFYWGPGSALVIASDQASSNTLWRYMGHTRHRMQKRAVDFNLAIVLFTMVIAQILKYWLLRNGFPLFKDRTTAEKEESWSTTTTVKSKSIKLFKASNVWYMSQNVSTPGTYDHRLRKLGHPVRSAILKPQIGKLVVEWVTISESLLLYVFNFLSLILLVGDDGKVGHDYWYHVYEGTRIRILWVFAEIISFGWFLVVYIPAVWLFSRYFWRFAQLPHSWGSTLEPYICIYYTLYTIRPHKEFKWIPILFLCIVKLSPGGSCPSKPHAGARSSSRSPYRLFNIVTSAPFSMTGTIYNPNNFYGQN